MFRIENVNTIFSQFRNNFVMVNLSEAVLLFLTSSMICFVIFEGRRASFLRILLHASFAEVATLEP